MVVKRRFGASLDTAGIRGKELLYFLYFDTPSAIRAWLVASISPAAILFAQPTARSLRFLTKAKGTAPTPVMIAVSSAAEKTIRSDVSASFYLIFVRVVIGISLTAVHRAVEVIRGTINRIKFNWLFAYIGNVMPSSGWYEHSPVRTHFFVKGQLIFTWAHLDTSFALLQTQKLVVGLMHF